ncbi:interleukin-17C [Nothobranchius furzeri]|uniref:Interleukin 17C n=1 Tax=Nothobranchius furzeri TaxID=105023 RepID=A0A1A7Z9X2_NOTFU|nr:interleukin-17C [Nothobranchius furzeri]KAF7225003.1 interleukin 17C [Nothobranchius furzeri]
MDLKQILVLALCVVSVWTCRHRCCNQTELLRRMQKQLPFNPEPLSELSGIRSCPVDLYQGLSNSKDIKDRSLSPWRYVQETNEDLFPSTYMKAECLCSGCITIKKNSDESMEENFDFNSVPVLQAQMFLKRERGNCEDGTYQLRAFKMDIPVGCTCVRPKRTS